MTSATLQFQRSRPCMEIKLQQINAGPAVCCSACGLREHCLPGTDQSDSGHFDSLVYVRRRIKRGEALYRAGDAFRSLFAIRSGSFKTFLLLDDGREQVSAFYLPGELLGMDGIGNDMHNGNAVALEDSEVCVLPYAVLEDAALGARDVQRRLAKVLSRELVRDQGVFMLLGSMNADERVASFLLNLAQRYRTRGYSASEFNLRMTREELGSYLGLKLETVSRTFSRLQDEGLIGVQNKCIRIHDPDGLKKVVGRHLAN